jgi:hypothetical protein
LDLLTERAVSTLIQKKIKHSLGFQVILCFSIAQHSRDKLLLSKISEYLACGYIPKGLTRPDGAEFVVYKFSDISEKIIVFRTKYYFVELA